jgi:hypothetical protein
LARNPDGKVPILARAKMGACVSIGFQEEKMAIQPVSEKVKLTTEREKEGYWVEDCRDRVLVWHKKNQIASFTSLWTSTGRFRRQ